MDRGHELPWRKFVLPGCPSFFGAITDPYFLTSITRSMQNAFFRLPCPADSRDR